MPGMIQEHLDALSCLSAVARTHTASTTQAHARTDRVEDLRQLDAVDAVSVECIEEALALLPGGERWKAGTRGQFTHDMGRGALMVRCCGARVRVVGVHCANDYSSSM